MKSTNRTPRSLESIKQMIEPYGSFQGPEQDRITTNDTVAWNCHKCGSNHSSKLRNIIMRIERGAGLCTGNYESKKSKQVHTQSSVAKLVSLHDCTLSSKHEGVVKLSDKIEFVCNVCKTVLTISLASTLAKLKAGSMLCRICAGQGSRTRRSIVEWESVFQQHDAQLLWDSGKIPALKDTVRWKCLLCLEEITSVLSTLNKIQEGPYCTACVKRRKEYDALKQKLEERGGQLLSPLSDYLDKRTSPLRWTCCTCQKEQCSTAASWTKTYTCRSCGIKGATGGLSWDSFKADVEMAGWDMLSESLEYKQTTTLLRVRCNHGREFTTSYSRFRAGHRCMCSMKEAKKISLQQAKQEFATSGFVPLFDEYDNNKTPLKCICPKCKQIKTTTLSHVRKQSMCRQCMEACNRLSQQEVLALFEKASCELMTNIAEYRNVKQKLVYRCYCGNEGETCVKAFRKGVRCAQCAVKKRNKTNIKVYGCANAAQSETVKDRIRNTWIKLYGVDHNSKVPEVLAKREQTNIERRGVTTALLLPEVREAGEKALVDKYGTAHVLSKKEFRDKSQTTSMERYGAKQYIQSDKGKARMKELYGSEHHAQTDNFKSVMVQRYGVEHAMHCPELASKAHSSGYSSKAYIFPSGRVEMVMGYEPYAINELLQQGVQEQNIVVGMQLVPTVKYTLDGSQRIYYPDILISGDNNYLIEVKSTYTVTQDREKNKAKWEAASRVMPLDVRVYGRVKGAGIRLCKMVEYRNGKRSHKHIYGIDETGEVCVCIQECL